MPASAYYPGRCEHEWTGPNHAQTCSLCDTTCTRGSDGKISTYSAGLKLTATSREHMMNRYISARSKKPLDPDQ